MAPADSMVCRLISLWLCLFCFTASPATPKSPAKKPARPTGQRFLFVLEVSSAMRKFEHSGRQVVFDLIYSGLDGQMRVGDTYGVWTFDQDPHAGLFPMQTWSPAESLDLASRTGLFLQSQPSANSSSFGPTVKKLSGLVKSIGDVTIFIISAGNGAFEGTAFDGEINATLAERESDRKRTRKPFVITLVARSGQIVSGSVTLAGEAISLPERPVPVQVTETTEDNPPPVPAKTATGTNRVMRIVTSPPKVVDQKTTNTVAEVQKSSADVAEISKGDVNRTPDLENSVTTPTTAVAASTDSPGIGDNSQGAEKLNVVPSNASTTSTADNAPATASPPPNVDSASAAVKTSPLRTAATIPADQSETPDTSQTSTDLAVRPTSLPSLVPASVKAAARENSSRSTAINAFAAPPASMMSPQRMLVIGVSLLVSAVGLMVLFFWRSRSPSQPSYISRSMERK